MKLKLAHRRNPDIAGGYWQRPKESGKAKFVDVKTFAEASQVCLRYIQTNELGGGNWSGGDILNDNSEQIAYVSYNGRVWHGSLAHRGAEILTTEEI